VKGKKERVIERFVDEFEYLVKELENYAGYLELGEEGEQLKNDAIAILKKKLKKMKKAEDMKDYKKVIRVNKLLEKEGIE